MARNQAFARSSVTIAARRIVSSSILEAPLECRRGDMDEVDEVPKPLECRVMRNDDKGWYWEVVAGYDVLARGIAETENEALAEAADAKQNAERRQ